VRPWTILCDFDGTVSLPDATDTLLEQCAAPQWKSIERDWRAGLIGSRDCMTRQIALIDASEQELNHILDTIPIDPAFAQFVSLTRDAGITLTIVSDGLDRAISRILGNHGLGHLPIVANHLDQVGVRRWAMQSPHTDAACRSQSGTCKCALAGSHADRANVLLIGDGQSDVCVSACSDFVFAKARLLEHCRATQVAHRPIAGFTDAIALLPDLLAGRFDRVQLPALPLLPQRVEYA
jgi:2-hydroxy-3-keto-5-methylthiopentenyl-1-phosphate phosphatase